MAGTFLWHNDPDSDFDGSQVVRQDAAGKKGHDSITYANFQAINTSGHTLPDVGVFIPFAWAGVTAEGDPNGAILNYEALSWDNSRMGFVDPDYNHTGESVLLTPTILKYSNDHLLAGSIADKTDTHTFAQSSASVGIGVGGRPVETFDSGDLLPFADLGSLGTGGKTFSMKWTTHWDGPDHGGVRVGGYGATIVPDSGQPAAASTVESYNVFRFDA
jgi:hypothetical protein